MPTNKVNFNTVRSVFFFGLIILLGIAMLYLIGPFLYPIFWAAVIAVMFYPVYTWFFKHTRSPRTSSIITITLVISLVILPLLTIALLVTGQSVDLVRKALQVDFLAKLEEVKAMLGQLPIIGSYIFDAWDMLTNWVFSALGEITTHIVNAAQEIVGASVVFIAMFFTMLYTLYYFLKDGDKMLKRLMFLSPLGDKYEEKLYKQFTSTVRATLKSTLIVGGVQGTLGGLLLWITGVPGALIWTFIMVLISIIPAIGPALVLIPTAIVLFALGNVWQGIVLVVGAFVISLVDNFLRPMLVGKDIQMHPLVVFFATLGGLILFGISGFIIGPIIAALFLAIISIYNYYYKAELGNN